MTDFSPIDGIGTIGFAGGSRIGALRATMLSEVPLDPGVYLVWRESARAPTFVAVSTGGWFKARNPSVSSEFLTTKWVDGAQVLYIGKGDASALGRRGLRKRLTEYLRFGAGDPVGHWGGRLIWHLEDADQLRLFWKVCSEPRAEERRLLGAFVSRYGRLPFANLRN